MVHDIGSLPVRANFLQFHALTGQAPSQIQFGPDMRRRAPRLDIGGYGFLNPLYLDLAQSHRGVAQIARERGGTQTMNFPLCNFTGNFFAIFLQIRDGLMH